MCSPKLFTCDVEPRLCANLPRSTSARPPSVACRMNSRSCALKKSALGLPSSRPGVSADMKPGLPVDCGPATLDADSARMHTTLPRIFYFMFPLEISEPRYAPQRNDMFMCSKSYEKFMQPHLPHNVSR